MAAPNRKPYMPPTRKRSGGADGTWRWLGMRATRGSRIAGGWPRTARLWATVLTVPPRKMPNWGRLAGRALAAEADPGVEAEAGLGLTHASDAECGLRGGTPLPGRPLALAAAAAAGEAGLPCQTRTISVRVDRLVPSPPQVATMSTWRACSSRTASRSSSGVRVSNA